MEVFRIEGGVPLAGEVAVGGAKNAALPIMAAALLADGPVRLEGVPDLLDVAMLSAVLERLGTEARRTPCGDLLLETVDTRPVTAPYELVRQMRASFCVLGPLLARRGRAVVSLPGGCDLGPRPVDLHLAGLRALGAEVWIEHGYVVAEAAELRGAEIHMSGRCGPTVTGTANVMSAAVLANGVTVLTGAAMEPEIVDLGNFLIALGARIEGLGTPTVVVEGVEQLDGAAYRVIPDRIEAATLLAAAAITGGCATVNGARPEHLASVLERLEAMGCLIDVEHGAVRLAGPQRPRPADIAATAYPGVPTDVQSQLTAIAGLAGGTSIIEDRVFPQRVRHVAELNRLGASMTCRDGQVVVRGVPRYSGAEVTASDLRGSAALVLAGLAAEGETIIHGTHHLDRGYERLEHKLAQLGARIERVENGTADAAPLKRSA